MFDDGTVTGPMLFHYFNPNENAVNLDPTSPQPPLAASLFKILIASFRLFDWKARLQMILLVSLMILGAMLEALGAAIVVPFIAILNDFSYLTSHPIIHALYLHSAMESPERFLVLASLVLLSFFVGKNLYLAAMASAQFRFIYTQMPIFSTELLKRYMARPLSSHISTNSAEMIRNAGNEVFMFFTNFLIPAMTLFTELLVLAAILIALILIEPIPAFLAVTLLGSLTTIFYSFVRKKVRRYGQSQQHHNAERIKWINQAFGSIKETKVLRREQFFINQFCNSEKQFSLSARYAMLLNQIPRLFIETVAFSALFIGVATALSMGAEPASVLPVLALFAVASVRLLPSVNRILLSITRMAYYRPAAKVVLEAYAEKGEQQRVVTELAEPMKANWRELRFVNVCFSYPEGREIFSSLNLTIRRGASVALIGPSGCGKTTLADLALGLLQPTAGVILLDDQDIQTLGEQWQTHLGYIPQAIYLLDDTIRRNVAFGIPDEVIDDNQVWHALRLARLEEHVRRLPDQLSTIIGENGCKLSGGQRQRLGIARALFNEPDFIVFDEATSALDETTEQEISDTLESLKGKMTLLIIAHRPKTIERCEFNYNVQDRNIYS